VPEGYPNHPVKGQLIDISRLSSTGQLYFGSVEKTDGENLKEIGSRTLAVVGIADDLEMAEAQAEKLISQVSGPLFHRKDIGTAELVQRRINHMRELRPND